MPSVLERILAAFIRACAIVVAGVPLIAVGVLSWAGFAAALSRHALPGASGFAATVPFTLAVSAVAAGLGGTVGIGCAIAAEELAPAAVRGAIGAAIGFLGALPAVAFGWFASNLIVPVAAGRALGNATPFFAATAVLAVMVAPTTCALVTRALRRVPDSARQAAAAAGASRLQTMALVVIPAFRRRIFAAVLAAFARAIGEATAMQVVFATLARHGIDSAGTTAGWILGTLVLSPTAGNAADVSFAALALVVGATVCGLFVAREYRGMQWA